MPEEEDTRFYEGGPTVEPEPGEDDWFDSAQMGKINVDPNNDLRGDTDGP